MASNIEREELKQRMDRGEVFVLAEVLAPKYYRHSHLPGAINLPPGSVQELAGDLLRDKASEIILYCWDDT